MLNGYGVLSAVVKVFWSQVEVMGAQYCEYIKCHGIIDFTLLILCFINFTSIKKQLHGDTTFYTLDQ